MIFLAGCSRTSLLFKVQEQSWRSESSREFELPEYCQQLNRNPLKTPKGCNSGAVPSETQGSNKNQLLNNSGLPGSQGVAQTATVREGSCQLLTPRALSNHKAAVSAQSPVTHPASRAASPNTFGHQFKDYSTPLCSKLGESLLSGTWNKTGDFQKQGCKVSGSHQFWGTGRNLFFLSPAWVM